jgi:hypothetical protein
MSTSGRFPTHHVPDEGVRYSRGNIVRIDQSSGAVRIIKDAQCDYEVMNYRRATGYGDNPPLLRIGLQKRMPQVLDDAGRWAPR